MIMLNESTKLKESKKFIYYQQLSGLKSWGIAVHGASLVSQRQTICLPVQEVQETQVQSLGQEDPLEGGHGNPLQYSCLGNPKDRGAWRATVHGVAKSQTRLSAHTHSDHQDDEETNSQVF